MVWMCCQLFIFNIYNLTNPFILSSVFNVFSDFVNRLRPAGTRKTSVFTALNRGTISSQRFLGP